jgi:hypothetical protein
LGKLNEKFDGTKILSRKFKKVEKITLVANWVMKFFNTKISNKKILFKP